MVSSDVERLVTRLLLHGMGSVLFLSSVIIWMLETSGSMPSNESPSGFDSTLYVFLRGLGILTSDMSDAEVFCNVTFSIIY